MSKIIFLDIDGVLNNEVFVNSFWEILKQLKMKRPEAKELHQIVMRDDYGNLFCPTACKMLKLLVERTGAKIVISSAWRKDGGLIEMQNMWKHRQLPGDVIDITPIRDNEPRGEEIAEWLSKNEHEEYVILDDDSDMLEEQKNNFVQQDSRYGLTFNDTIKAIRILNGKIE
jgi:hypothetical protein